MAEDDQFPDVSPLILDALVDKFVEAFYDPKKLRRVEQTITNAHEHAGSTLFGLAIGMLDEMLDWLGEHIEPLEDKASRILSPILARLVGHILGADVSTNAIRERVSRAGDTAIGKLVAETIFDVIRAPEGELTPGSEGARRLVGALGHMTVNNWAEGIVFEWVASLIPDIESVDAIPELARELINNTGLSRLTRVALRPLAATCIATPMQWELNKRYRPVMLPAAAAIRHWLRGHLDAAELDEILAREGHGERAIEALMFDARKFLSPAEAVLLERQEVWTRDEALQHLRDDGRNDADAHRDLELEELKDVRKFQIESADFSVRAYAERQIDRGEFDLAIDAAGLNPTTRDRLRAIGLHRREINITRLSLGQAESAVEQHIWSFADYRRYLDDRGYRDEDITTLDLLLRAKLGRLEDVQAERAQAAADRDAEKAVRQADARARRDAIVRARATFSGAPAQAERLVIRGLMSVGTYRQILIDHGLSPDDATVLGELARQDAAAHAEAQARRAAAAAQDTHPTISIGDLERAVRLGTLSLDAFRAALDDRGFSDADINVLVTILTRELADLVDARRRRDEATARLATRSLSLADEERAVRDGLLSLDQYRGFLTAEKFSPADVATLAALLERELDDDRAAEQRRADAAARLARQEISLADLEQAVRRGLRTMDDYRGFLLAHGFSSGDVATLVALLARQVDADQAAAAAHATATTTLAARSLSLGQVETAVLAGVLSLADYRAFLERERFADADVATLVDLLTGRLVRAAESRQQLGAAETAPDGRGVSLQEMRRAVLVGLRPIGAYAALLASQGYTEDAIATLLELLQVDLDHQAAAAATRALAAKKLADKNIALDDIERQVTSGIRSIDDYAVFLVEQGFALEDVGALVDLLAQQLPAPA